MINHLEQMNIAATMFLLGHRQIAVLSSLPVTTAVIGGTTTGGTSVEVDTQSISMILGFQPTENWNIYGGVYQTIKGDVSLRGSAYSVFNGYDAKIKEDSAAGWSVCAAFQIPEIALKASLTYRSEIDHEFIATENLSLAAPLVAVYQVLLRNFLV